jgi:hypothetical protein
VTAFFIPDTPAGESTARAYADLRCYAELTAGRPVRSARIFKLSWRRGGTDWETCVGKQDPAAGQTVHAIFDIGGDYMILWRGGRETVTKRQTYTTVEFD